MKESFFYAEKSKLTSMVVLRLQALTSESMDRYVPPRGQAVSCLALLSSHLGTAVLDVPQQQLQQQQHANNNVNQTRSTAGHHR